MSNDQIWEKVLDILRPSMAEISFTRWFSPLYIYRIDEEANTIYIASKEPVVIKFINDLYKEKLEDAFFKVLSKNYRIIVRHEKDYIEDIKPEKKRRSKTLSTSKDFNPLLTFENFVVGDNNKYAHAAALAVAEFPSDAYNPLFIHGGSGLGKTHLMQAIATYIIRQNPKTDVLYVSSEMFTNDLISSISDNKLPAFKKKYRNVDVLLIDDIQFLEGKYKIQEEFFYTFEELYRNNKQIVITSDRPPARLENLEERLTSRFSMTMTAEVTPADFETRVAILKKKAEIADLEWTEELYDVCSIIADNFKDDIRALEGAFNQVVKFSNLMQEDITVPFAKRMLKNIIRDNKKSIAPERIKSIVCRYYKVKISDIDSTKRNAEIVLPRQVAMYLCRENTDLSFTKIGSYFGDHHHSTVMHAYNKISERYNEDDDLKKEIDEITKRIKDNQ